MVKVGEIVDIIKLEIVKKDNIIDLEVVEKFNPYHDRLGRFTSPGGATSMTIRTRSGISQRAADKAVERSKQQHAGTMPTEAQAKTLKSIETRTRNLKKEQLRVVDRDGNVIMQKQGDAWSVSYKIREARDNFPGNITIHNHPAGGTFSSPDLTDFGHGVTEIRAATPEGTYIMRDIRHGAKYNLAKEKTWYDMKEDIENTSQSFKNERLLYKDIKEKYQDDFQEKVSSWAHKWANAKDNGASQETLQKYADEYNKANDAWNKEMKPKIKKEVRAAYVDQYHQWYKSNAHNYGMEYEFIPIKTRASKGYDEIVEKSADTGEIVLDGQMNKDIEELTNELIKEITKPLK